MKNLWPFAFFPGMSAEKEPNEASDVTPVEDMEIEEVVIQEDAVEAEDIAEDYASDEDDDSVGDYEDLAFAVEVDLEEAARIEKEKARTRKKVIAGLSLLGAAGLATGFALRAYIKNRK